MKEESSPPRRGPNRGPVAEQSEQPGTTSPRSPRPSSAAAGAPPEASSPRAGVVEGEIDEGEPVPGEEVVVFVRHIVAPEMVRFASSASATPVVTATAFLLKSPGGMLFRHLCSFPINTHAGWVSL